MLSDQQSAPNLNDVVRTHRRYWKRWLAVVLVIWSVAAAFIVFGMRPWEASQGIVLRFDAIASSEALGKLQQEELRKSNQETILQLSLSRCVLRNALLRVGAPTTSGKFVTWESVWPMKSSASQAWPSERAVVDLREASSLTPPRGAEFGKTDVFYLKVKDRDRPRALALVSAIYAELEKTYGELRAQIAHNTLTELQEAVRLAQENLIQATQRMAKIEKDVGVDLIALRMLQDHPNNEIALYRELTNATGDLRQLRVTEAEQATLQKLLELAKTDPRSLQSGPRHLLDSHPSISRLIQGLSETRLRAAALASRLTEADPELAAARREEAETRREIDGELAYAIQGVKAGQELTTTRRKILEEQVGELKERVDRLTQLRAEYASVTQQVTHRQTLLEEAQRNLAQTCAAQAAARQASLLSPIDDPDGGLRPVGPSRAMIALLGLIAGLIGGSGVVFLTAPPVPHSDSRKSPPSARSSAVWPREEERLAAEAESEGKGHGVRQSIGV